MERLTEFWEGHDIYLADVYDEEEDTGGIGSIPIDSGKVDKIIQRLGEYEQAEEDGLLIRLPCKEGTEVFLSDYLDHHFKLKEYRFCGSQVVMVIECFELNNTCKRMLNDFGKTVFTSKAEAEQALADRKEE